ncbi:MAG: hypothetical protein IKN42_02990 [Elusimicrobia bacterium]|nr:hypothetical protein [Elusimicrobiota bacterium]
MKKILSIMLTLCLFANISFAAFDPYADDEVEKKSYKKLYYGIVLTLIGGFLTYDGFSTEKVDVSKPSVDYTTVLHSEWTQQTDTAPYKYEIKSGWTEEEYYRYDIDGKTYNLCKDELDAYNRIYNNGNVDLKHITIEVRYKYAGGTVIVCDDDTPGFETNGANTSDGYHEATFQKTIEDTPVIYNDISLKKGQAVEWKDLWGYSTSKSGGEKSSPNGNDRVAYIEGQTDGTEGLNFQGQALTLMDIRVKLNKNKQYKPIYETRHKSDIEGVAGILIGITGIYFIVDHFLDMHKFNAYAKRHNLNLKVATASNEYKLMLQKRI